MVRAIPITEAEEKKVQESPVAQSNDEQETRFGLLTSET